MVKRVVLIVGALAVVVGGALLMTRKGTDAQQLGEPTPPDVKAVQIADILQNPTQFRDALVVTEGLIGAVGCED